MIASKMLFLERASAIGRGFGECSIRGGQMALGEREVPALYAEELHYERMNHLRSDSLR